MNHARKHRGLRNGKGDSVEASICIGLGAMSTVIARKVKGCCLTAIRYEGPEGAPGMWETPSPSAIVADVGLKAAQLAGGRFSSVTRGTRIGHLAGNSGRRISGAPARRDITAIGIPCRTLRAKPEERRKARAGSDSYGKENRLARYAQTARSAKDGVAALPDLKQG